MGAQICLSKSSQEWSVLIFRWRSMVPDLLQLRWDQVRPGQGTRRGSLPEIGRDRALEKLLRGLVDVQIPDSGGRCRRRPSCLSTLSEC